LPSVISLLLFQWRTSCNEYLVSVPSFAEINTPVVSKARPASRKNKTAMSISITELHQFVVGRDTLLIVVNLFSYILSLFIALLSLQL